MKLLFLGDIFGRPGRQAVKDWLPGFRARQGVDWVVANAENAAGGKGTTARVFDELIEAGVDCMTGGNHSFHHRESYTLFDSDERILRPANFAPGAPGRGMGIYRVPESGVAVAVISLQGRAMIAGADSNPFRAAEALVAEARETTPIIFVDFHAETTSEKIALTHFLDGRVTAVVGTHTHVPTADARVTAAGTAAVTDSGMCGPYDSVIGIEAKIVIEQMTTGMPVRHKVATGDVRICGLLIEVDEATGRATAVEQIIQPKFGRRGE